MTEPTPSRDDIRQQAERVRDSRRRVDELLADTLRRIASAARRAAESTRDDYALAPPVDLTSRQDAAVRALETPAGVGAGMESPEGATGPQAGAGRCERMTADTVTDDELDALYARLDRAEKARTRWRDYVQRCSDRSAADLQRMADLVTAAERTRQHQAADADRYEAQLRTDLAEARDERDRARRIAVELEQQLARATAQITTN